MWAPASRTCCLGVPDDGLSTGSLPRHHSRDGAYCLQDVGATVTTSVAFPDSSRYVSYLAEDAIYNENYGHESRCSTGRCLMWRSYRMYSSESQAEKSSVKSASRPVYTFVSSEHSLESKRRLAMWIRVPTIQCKVISQLG